MKYSSAYAPVRHMKLSKIDSMVIVAYHDYFKNSEDVVLKLVNNSLCIFDHETGKLIYDINTSGESVLSLDILERKHIAVTLEGVGNNVFLYNYVEGNPLLKFNLTFSGQLMNINALSLHVHENSNALMTAF